MVVCKEVIVSKLCTAGDGKSTGSPMRLLTQVHEKDGELIAERDPCGFKIEDLADLADFVSEGKGGLDAWLRLRGEWSFSNP